MPRCRTCPVRLAAEIRGILSDEDAGTDHLAGIPPCLHKYEPLFRRDGAETRLPTGT